MDKKALGERTEAITLAEFIKRGIPVSVPFGDNQKYDLIIDINNRLYRIQCKTAWNFQGQIRFATASNCGANKTIRKKYQGLIDYFVVYYPDNKKLYILPIDEVTSLECVLRLSKPRNGQNTGIKWASNYEFDVQIPQIGT